MSTMVPAKGHRATRSVASPSATTTSQNPQNPHHLNSQAHALNPQSEMTTPNRPTTPPRTPRRNEQPPSHTKQNANNTHGSKQKTRNKRPKNVMTSPAANPTERKTPPLTSSHSAGLLTSAKPISTPSAAYAGGTFHASPAPSALPIPSFYSKSVPESPGPSNLRSSEVFLSDSPTPASASILHTEFPRDESPLDVFFKADREEKARARSASSTQAMTPDTGPFRPPLTSSQQSQIPPTTSSQSRPRNPNRMSSSGMFAMELDGESAPGTPYGPAFSTPYSDRINAARSPGATDHISQLGQPTSSSEALKAYLFSPVSTSSLASSAGSELGRGGAYQSSTGQAIQRSGIPSRSQNHHILSNAKTPNYASRASGRSSGLCREVTPSRTPTKTPSRSVTTTNSPTPPRIYANSTPTSTTDMTPHPPIPSYDGSSGNKNTELQILENSLRKILKLDSNSVKTGPGVEGVSISTAAFPNYSGGRFTPRNSTNNGVMRS